MLGCGSQIFIMVFFTLGKLAILSVMINLLWACSVLYEDRVVQQQQRFYSNSPWISYIITCLQFLVGCIISPSSLSVKIITSQSLPPHPCGCSSSPADTSPHGISCITFHMHKTNRNIFFSFYSLLPYISLDACVSVGKYIILSCVLFIYVWTFVFFSICLSWVFVSRKSWSLDDLFVGE